MMRPPFISLDSGSHLLSCEYGTRTFRASYSLSYVQHVTACITTTQAAPASHSRSPNPSCYDDQMSMEEALRMDDEDQKPSHHQLRQLDAQRMDEDAERQAMLMLQEWLGLAENPDKSPLHQKAELPLLKKGGLGGTVGDGGGGGSRGDTHRKRMQDTVKEKGGAQAEPRVKAKEKAKAMGSGKDRSDVWVERIRGGLCCVRKTSEKKKKKK